jgi:hypothetical protein
MRVLNNLKQRIVFPTETLMYMKTYQRIYKRVILEEEKKDIMTNVYKMHLTQIKQYGR